MPINYADYFAGIKTPIETAMQGYSLALSGENAAEQRKMREMQQEAAKQKQEKIKKEQDAAISLQKELTALTQKEYDNPKQKLQDYYDVITRNPSLAEHLKYVTQPLSEEVKNANAAKSLSVYTALQNDMPEKAKEMLIENKEAAKNSGNEEEAQMMQGLVDMIDNGNTEAAKTGSALYASYVMGPEKTIENFTKIQEELRKQAREGYEIKKIEKQLEAMESGEIPKDPEKMFEAENGLRKEYAGQTKDFTTIEQAYGRIKAVDASPAGDIALIFNYMKMLDPNSVVRESEYATAENAAGVPERIKVQYNKLLSGEKLGPEQRKDFKTQSGKLFESSKEREKDVREKLVKIAKQYGLNEKNIFYVEPEQVQGGTEQSGNASPEVLDKIKNRSYMRFAE